MTTIMKASHQWATRPADERFLSLSDMQSHFATVREQSKALVIPSQRIDAFPAEDNKGLQVTINGTTLNPTNWAFGQLAQRAEAPAGYLRTLHPAIASDCINYGLKIKRNIEDVGVLARRNGDDMLNAVTGPNYGRIWNSDVVEQLIRLFGNGVDGQWTVPGEFGKAVEVTKSNTTLYASDRDMFVFLADEKNRIEIPNRRDGQPGSLARGFFAWNSEVGSSIFGLATFLFDYVCCNRIVWGAEEYGEVRIRHTSSAPDRYLEEMAPALEVYAQSSAKNIVNAVEQAQAKRLEDKVDDFIATRFGKRFVQPFNLVHVAEENRPIETLWDVTTAATAYARNVKHQDERVDIERKAGKVMALAA
jgi:hypothetical protein